MQPVYSALLEHFGSLPVGSLHTQLPPVSERILAFECQCGCACMHEDTHIDGNNVCHGKECGEAGTNLSCELGVFDFFLLDAVSGTLLGVGTYCALT